ncbi:stage III sporulation protein AD [Desulforamulus hydrothermalis]|uniref:Stage III sporulation protein AD n=1 Tax=Desulforamulus hydrothermalis Lam5 = DSM 18033 TaxID=1121428 RepID=K8EBA0_9FIRM|nr:stage III sporulation protein AD [Desulforamulus hydrothermalis]CCO08908.1 Stage III sporulation protein AD [Desulforamulus hydrothermalis Lam5 = DSM 18033]SHG74515.1 stage III sporulation protein AD [Desulforamulus hydrothermalis Lam5 = DSM 18033]
MDILQIVGLGLVVCVLAVILRQQKPPMAALLTMTAGVIIFLLMMPQIAGVFNILKDLAAQANINMAYMGTILKIVGIAYIADFGSQICRDAGESALAAKIEFAAKIIVLVMAVPIIVAVLQSLIKLVP